MTGGRLEVTFVGNEGVHLGDGRRGVLIDALFGDGAAAYTTTPRGVVDAVEMARPPFDRVDAVLATHHHPDHFNAYSVARHLQHNDRAHVLTTRQASRELRAKGFDSLAPRVTDTVPEEGVRRSFDVGGVEVDTFGLSHGKVNYGDVEHMGVIVRLGGVTLLHLGDGVIAERSLRDAGVLSETIDAAFLPFWFVTYPFGRRLLETAFRPRRIFAVHIPPEHETRIVAEIGDAAVPLTRPMSRHEID